MSISHERQSTSLETTENRILDQLRSLLPIMLVVYIPVICLLMGLIVVNRIAGIPIAYFTRDPITAITDNAPCYAGCVSNLGILIWCATASICVFSGQLLRSRSEDKEWSFFLIISGLATAGIMLDDLFMLHEEVLPDHFGLPQIVVYGLYASAALGYLLRFHRTILDTEFLLLALAMAFLAFSISLDLLPYEDFYIRFIADDFLGRHLVEDGAKLFGIVTWCVYFTRIAWRKAIQVGRPLLNPKPV